jgi:UDP-N-acetylmuramoylalanine--D-glutamate ligase
VKVLVFGLGTFGGQIAVARYFAARGATVTVTDRKPREKLESSVAELEGTGARFVLGEHREEDVLEADLVVRSPAVRPDDPLLEKARARGIRVTTELALTLGLLEAPFVAVTGTKGKSTTTALLGAILERGPGPVIVGGNIGKPLLEKAETIPRDALVVFELSSFMAEDMALVRAAGEKVPSPRLLVVTSLAPEHLDRHLTKEAYYEAKLSLLDGMGASGVCVYADSGELGALLPARARKEGVRLVPVVARREGDAITFRGERLFSAAALTLPGEHNVQNAALAAVAARELGATPDAIERGVAAFRPLAHRLETVARDALGREYVNDSIATTPEAAIAGLEAFRGRPVVVLLGGSEKGSDYRELAEVAARRAHAIVCLGTTGPKIAALLNEAVGRLSPVLPRPAVVETRTLEDAFALARGLCPEGGVVLLSPACASLDAFKNFEERGERFGALARG